MKANYLKFVQWSEEDEFFVGYCPDLFIGGVCHGKDEQRVYAQLCSLVTEELAQFARDQSQLPPRIALVATPVPV